MAATASAVGLVLVTLCCPVAAVLEPTGEDEDHIWIVVAGLCAGFFMAWGIGANDVANSFASSVGSKSLTLRQAVAIASVMEFVGCVSMGASVSETVRKGIIDSAYFQFNPELLQLAMLSSLLGAGLWLLICSTLGSPVSTTHSIIGSLIGVSICTNPDSLKVKTVGLVVLSWVTSPVCSAIIAAGVFLLIRMFILRSPHAESRVFRVYPLLLFMTLAVVCLYVTFKNPQVELKSWRKEVPGFAVLAAFGVALVAAGIIYAATISMLRRRAQGDVDAADDTPAEVPTDPAARRSVMPWDQDLHAEACSEKRVLDIQTQAEEFPAKTERLFSFLQVMSAAFDSLAHGANDVANAVGPVAAIWGIHKDGFAKEMGVPIWILALGGVGITVGLLTYGYNVIKSIGVKLTKITPSRGFSIEMGSSIVVIVGSNLGIPLSTTHCQVGATVGVGMCEIHGASTIWKGVNWRLMGKVLTMWVLTLVFAGLCSSAIYGFLSSIYHPMSRPLDCGSISARVGSVQNAWVNVTEGDMQALFKSMDIDGDELLTGNELKAQGLDKTLGGDETTKKWGRRRRRRNGAKEMDEQDFLQFTCLKDRQLDHMKYNKCEPQCVTGYRADKDLKCVLEKGTSAEGSYRLSTRYSGFSECKQKGR